MPVIFFRLSEFTYKKNDILQTMECQMFFGIRMPKWNEHLPDLAIRQEHLEQSQKDLFF